MTTMTECPHGETMPDVCPPCQAAATPTRRWSGPRTAYWHTTCGGCPNEIIPGDTIYTRAGERARHADCV